MPYVTRSPFLARHARELYYAHGYENERQNVEFLAFGELLESIRVPEGRERRVPGLPRLARSASRRVRASLAHPLYEEFQGVLTGLATDRPWLARADYLALGVRRSIFLGEDRGLGLRPVRALPRLAERLRPLRPQHRRPALSRRGAGRATTSSVVDEVQDLTNVQLALVLRMLRKPGPVPAVRRLEPDRAPELLLLGAA